MCKNEGNPCPGCKKNKPSEASWMFFGDDERQALEALTKTETPHGRAAHP
jgi:predicted Fe-S protein YdhL (DUF1289 family)